MGLGLERSRAASPALRSRKRLPPMSMVGNGSSSDLPCLACLYSPGIYRARALGNLLAPGHLHLLRCRLSAHNTYEGYMAALDRQALLILHSSSSLLRKYSLPFGPSL